MDRPEELNDPKKFDDLMEKINTKLAILSIPLGERANMSLIILTDELDYDIPGGRNLQTQICHRSQCRSAHP